DRWTRDLDGWRLIGLDAMLIGSGHRAERSQLRWLRRAMRDAAGHRLAWFLHRPLFLTSPDDREGGYWSVPPAERAPYLDLVERYGVELVSSGHLHRAHRERRGRTTFVWCPSSGFSAASLQRGSIPGEGTLGAVRLELTPAGLTVSFADIAGIVPHD